MINLLKKACNEFADFIDRNTSCWENHSEDQVLVGKIESLDSYQTEAAKTFNPKISGNIEESVKYLGLKLSEECGEINGPIAKHYYHGKSLDLENLKLEIGDLLWYLSNLSNFLGFKLSEVATANIEKLRKRHGEKYNQEHYTQEKRDDVEQHQD